MDLSTLQELSDILSTFCDTRCSIIQLENIFRFVHSLEAEMGSSSVQILKDNINSIIKDQGSFVSQEHINRIASVIFPQDSELKKKFLSLFSNELTNQSFSKDEFEEIDIDQDTSLSHNEETFHITTSMAEVTQDGQLYGTDKCPCVCHTEHHSVKHCFTCAIQFAQGCTYTSCKRDKSVLSTKLTSESETSLFYQPI
uniref:Uncharacterized protein n=1 Tax=Cacopsylla melanoneura TaxID=428564 RepID=A0A8D8UVI6_9HEMI